MAAAAISSLENTNKINVIIRVRDNTTNDNERIIKVNDDKTLVLHGQKGDILYKFNGISYKDSNVECFDKYIKAPLAKCIELGSNMAVLVYGQTATGKTFTILGEEDKGIAHYISTDFLKFNSEGITKCEIIEIYKNKIFDLIKPGDKHIIPRDTGSEILLSGADSKIIKTEQEFIQLISTARINRKCSSTLKNNSSSRSHVLIKLFNSNMSVLIGDLAGSESAKATYGLDRERFIEASYINKDLLAIGTIIRCAGKPNKTISYRSSILTLLLKYSVCDNNSNAIVISHISENKTDLTETANTLIFSKTADSVIYERIDALGKVTTIDVLKKENEKLKAKISELEHELAELKGIESTSFGINKENADEDTEQSSSLVSDLHDIIHIFEEAPSLLLETVNNVLSVSMEYNNILKKIEEDMHEGIDNKELILALEVKNEFVEYFLKTIKQQLSANDLFPKQNPEELANKEKYVDELFTSFKNIVAKIMKSNTLEVEHQVMMSP